MFDTGQERSAGPGAKGSLWTTAVFPSSAMRTEFRARVRLLNGIEDLPQIQVRDDARRTQLDYWCIDYRRIGLRSLVEACGGTIVAELAGGRSYEEQWFDTAVALS